MKRSSRAWIAAAAVAAIGAGAAAAAQTVPAAPTANQADIAADARPAAQSAAQPGPTREGRHGGVMNWIDVDRDGQLSRSEFEQAQQQALQRRMQMFDQADGNRDGLLTQDEMRAWRETMRARMSERGRHGHRHGRPERPGGTSPGGAADTVGS